MNTASALTSTSNQGAQMPIAKGEGGRGSPWTQNEIATLKRLYERTPWIGLRTALAGHSEGAIKARAYKLGIRRKGKGRAVNWTSADLNRLRRIYSSSSWPQLMAAFPEHTLVGIRKRAQAIGLRRPSRRAKPRFGLTRKLKKIREDRGISQREIERRMGFRGRAMAAIENGRDIYLSTLLSWVRALDLQLIVKPVSQSRLKESVNVNVCGRTTGRDAPGAVRSERTTSGEPNGVRTAPDPIGGAAFSA